MTAETDFSEYPELLSAMTVHLRAGIGKDGWNSTLAQWGDSDKPSGSFCIYTRPAVDDEWDSLRQNYQSFPDASGRCDVLEVKIGLHNHNQKWTSMRLGVPAARIGKNRTFDIILQFSGSSLKLYVDGVLVDEDWPTGRIPCGSLLSAADKKLEFTVKSCEILPRALSDAEIVERCGGAAHVKKRTLEILGAEREYVQYWTPRGHNQWVGDVMFGNTWSFDSERLHLFYLIDRRHHCSKFGQGGHSIAHMSSSDLVHWEQHPVAVELDEWNSLGTGRPVIHDGRLDLVYGMHTSRIFPEEQIITLKADENEKYKARPFSSAGIFPSGVEDEWKYPMGSTFAESTDGINFRKSNLLIHECQNPNVVRAKNGRGYLMLAGYGCREGLWQSDDLISWKLKEYDLIPCGKLSPEANTDECQCMFEWNGWHYILAGRTGFWVSRNQTGPYWEGVDGKNTGVTKPRWNLNEGLWVPMVAEFKNNRRILAGFLTGPDFGWAGHLVLRELIQFPDGTLGLKWPEEMRHLVRVKIIPEIRAGSKAVRGNSTAVNASADNWAVLEGLPRSFHLSMRITPEADTSHIAVAGLGENGDGCILSFLVNRGRVQWGTAKGDDLPQPVPTLEEIVSDGRGIWEKDISSHIHFNGGDFVISEVEGLEKPFDLEMVFFYDPKSRSTIIDACIAGHRTMITRRKKLILNKLRFMADGPAKFDNISIGEM